MCKFVFLIRIISSCFIIGFASAQKVIQLSYCSIDEDHLRMDCKYSLPSESSEVFCKYTHGERLFDTTDPSEEQHAPFKKRAKARIFPGNICRLLYKNLPNGKSTFTCNIKVGDSAPVTKTSVVEKSKMLILPLVWPICALPFIFTNKNRTCELDKQNAPPCEPVLLFSHCRAPPPLFCMECPITKLQWPTVDLDDLSHAAGNSLAVKKAPNCCIS